MELRITNGTRGRHRPLTLGGVMLSLAAAVGVGVFQKYWGEGAEEPQLPAAQRAAAALLPGGQVRDILRLIGEPGCRTTAEDGAERWIWPRGEAAAECVPSRGDLVVHIRGGAIESFVPEFAESREIRDRSQLADFHRRFGITAAQVP